MRTCCKVLVSYASISLTQAHIDRHLLLPVVQFLEKGDSVLCEHW